MLQVFCLERLAAKDLITASSVLGAMVQARACRCYLPPTVATLGWTEIPMLAVYQQKSTRRCRTPATLSVFHYIEMSSACCLIRRWSA